MSAIHTTIAVICIARPWADRVSDVCCGCIRYWCWWGKPQQVKWCRSIVCFARTWLTA